MPGYYTLIRTYIILLPLFFPLYLVRFDIFGIPFYLIEILILIAAVPVFFEMLIGDRSILQESILSKTRFFIGSFFEKKGDGMRDFIKSPYVPALLLIVSALISTFIVTGDDVVHALGILKSWIIIPFIYFVLVMVKIKSVKDVKWMLHAYLGSALILSLWGLWQAITGDFITIDQRISGPFESANYLALYIAPAFVYSAIRWFQSFFVEKLDPAEKRWNSMESRIFYSFTAPILLVALIFSQSYGGILGALMTLFIYLIYERIWVRKKLQPKKRKCLNIFISTIIVFGVLAGALAASLNMPKFTNLTKFNERTSIATRLEIWAVGAELIQENPLLGIGLGTFESNYIYRAEEILGHVPLEQKRLHSHNIFMEFWLNTGLLGLLAFIWLVLYGYFMMRSTKNRDMVVVGVAMLTYIVLHGLIDVHFWKNDLALVFWLVYSVILIPAFNE